MTAPVTTGTGAEPDPGLPVEDEFDDDLAPRRRMGALGIITVVVVALAVAAGAYVVTTHHFRQKTKLTYRVAAVFSLQQGECFNSDQNGLGVTVRACSSPHDAEVFATFTLAASAWPGVDAVQSQAQDGCDTRVASYMTPALLQNAFAQESFYPDEQTWQAGVRTVVCAARSTDGPITGSVRQSSSVSAGT
jgi:Septum formation